MNLSLNSMAAAVMLSLLAVSAVVAYPSNSGQYQHKPRQTAAPAAAAPASPSIPPGTTAATTTSTSSTTTTAATPVKPAAKKETSHVVRYDVSQTETGSKFVYELSDGQFREEEVIVLNRGTEEEEIAVIGSYSFWGTDNQLYITRYTAGRNGYSAHTSHTPRLGEPAQELKETAVWSKELNTLS